MLRKNAPNFDALAKHILAISDEWNQPALAASEPNGRLHAITAVIKTCFGTDGAEAIARDVITEFDEFAEALTESMINEAMEPSPTAREDHLARMLRREFSE